MPICIWSAAHSTDQGIYSIAMLLKELVGDVSKYSIQLVGTDISDQAIARASTGSYSEIEMARGLTDAAHLGVWKIRDEVRALASLRRLNLMEDFSAIRKFDVVFCRSVAIYFNDRDRASLFNRIGQRLEPDASLVIGSKESLSGLFPQFESKTPPTICVLSVEAEPEVKRDGCIGLMKVRMHSFPYRKRITARFRVIESAVSRCAKHAAMTPACRITAGSDRIPSIAALSSACKKG